MIGTFIGTAIVFMLMSFYIYDGYKAYKGAPEDLSVLDKLFIGVDETLRQVIKIGWDLVGILGFGAGASVLIFGEILIF